MPGVSRLLLTGACSLFALLCACSEDDGFDPQRPPPTTQRPTGTLVFDWSIEGRKDADACDEVGALTFEAIVVDEGFVIGDVSAPCEDFETSVELYADDFLTRSSLLDVEGVPALRRIIEDIFVIAEDKVTRLVMDFPSAAEPMDPVPDAGVPLPEPDAGPATTPDAAPPEEETPPVGDGLDAGVPDAAAPDAATAP